MSSQKVESREKYVVAVSGGVDSMVLLDMLAHGRCRQLQVPVQNLVVAHVNHGIRDDAFEDEQLVRGVAADLGLQFESIQASLGADASEETARKVRYNFLLRCCKKYTARLVTAHHQDDLVETMIINLLRGTGWRGLVSLDSSDSVIRPLLSMSKIELHAYAAKCGVQWREDSTNQNEDYLRNYVRLTLLPQLLKNEPFAKEKLLKIYQQTRGLKHKIATELQKFISEHAQEQTMSRYQLIMLPSSAAQEVLYHILTELDPDWHPTKAQIERALHFIKTAKAYKVFEVSGQLRITLTADAAQFKKV